MAQRAESTTAAEPEQLHLRVFAAVESMRGVPPDAGLWRVALMTAFGDRDSFTAGVRTVTRANVWSMAWSIFAHRDAAGISAHHVAVYADGPGLADRQARTAIAVLCALGLLKQTRRARKTALLALNIGALSWPEVLQRLRDDRSGGTGHEADDRSGGTGYVGVGVPEKQQLAAAAAATCSHTRRLDGLVGGIQSRRRRLGMRTLSEAKLRADVASGATTLDDLQADLDLLNATKRTRSRRRQRASTAPTPPDPGRFVCACGADLDRPFGPCGECRLCNVCQRREVRWDEAEREYVCPYGCRHGQGGY